MKYSELPKYYRESDCPPDVAIFQVTPMDKHGYFNFGPSASHLTAICETAKTIIVESNNPQVPELQTPPSTDIDKVVAKLIVDEIPDGACLQIGIGGMPNAVGVISSIDNFISINNAVNIDLFVVLQHIQPEMVKLDLVSFLH